ncbi:hypothetical protein [Sphingomonas qomolangmaensis]|uniref:ABC transporter permease n=1 Tax=Sphingomonas qomolangmaensis TaxID=2918765 RepID=A0ABY5LAN7_9SPHN|nr:hypothetical protein [Sphingomonas qomolangmaensis]UUL82875.1 hypothetical protein NMP03_01125 [Sphingomonas qomolangmaensis]
MHSGPQAGPVLRRALPMRGLLYSLPIAALLWAILLLPLLFV